jgi:Na+-translocating ferredoxin:NAD+ oxidoreductase subunit E
MSAGDPAGGGMACHAAPAAPREKKEPPVRDVLVRPLWQDNPVMVQLLGLCPALAVTNTVANALAMGLATFFVLMGSSILVSALKPVIPKEVRITAYILIIATFVTLVDMILAASVPDIHKALGAFIALIVCNCMILGRQEAFASRQRVGLAAWDAVGTGAGFTLAMVILGGVREVLGNGTFLGVGVMPAGFEPWIIMILPPGGFLTMGVVLLGFAWWHERGVREIRPRRWPHGVLPPEREVRPEPRPAAPEVGMVAR